MDQKTLSQRIHDGARAREVLENEAYIAAFDAINAEITEQWKSSPARDLDGREKLWMLQSLLGKLQQTLQTTLETGKLAELDLQHERTIADRARGFLGMR